MRRISLLWITLGTAVLVGCPSAIPVDEALTTRPPDALPGDVVNPIRPTDSSHAADNDSAPLHDDADGAPDDSDVSAPVSDPPPDDAPPTVPPTDDGASDNPPADDPPADDPSGDDQPPDDPPASNMYAGRYRMAVFSSTPAFSHTLEISVNSAGQVTGRATWPNGTERTLAGEVASTGAVAVVDDAQQAGQPVGLYYGTFRTDGTGLGLFAYGDRNNERGLWIAAAE